MQYEPLAISEQHPEPGKALDSPPTSQHGSLQQCDSSRRGRLDGHSGSASPHSVRRDHHDDLPAGFDAGHLDERLRGLSLGHPLAESAVLPGKRIADYENAVTPPTPKQGLGFKVIKRRSDSHTEGIHIEDFPNEVLTYILSHLHPDSHAAVSLVSKRFYALITTPHAWRMAFLRYFPAHTLLNTKSGKANSVWSESVTDVIRSETRHFTRLTPLATWRSEYLFRTRLIRSLERGKPGNGIGSSGRTSQSGKKNSAVLTYNSKLPWLITNIHAVFNNGKKPPRAIQGAAALGVGTMSDPTSGKIEKWGLEDPFSILQLDEIAPNTIPYGLGDGPAAVPNVMDVSQPYGLLAGEGFPGGRAYFRAVNENRGRYLGAESGVADAYPDIPQFPEMSAAVSAVWLAKSSAVPAATSAMVGMLVGSTLGVITAFALGWDSSGPRFASGDMTATWVLSPGVPIISIKVDDHYNAKRKSSNRVWAVALNALGEVFYLTETPALNLTNAKGEDVRKNAWYAGRTAYWHLLEATRRVARPDELDQNAIRGTYSPRSPADFMKLSQEQMAAEAREIEKYLHYKPSHFVNVCEGWDMRRRLEVDFANDDGKGAGEGIFVFDCGLAEGRPACVHRYQRTTAQGQQATPGASSSPTPPSLFGRVDGEAVESTLTPDAQNPKPPPPTPLSPGATSPTRQHEWWCHALKFKTSPSTVITATALDCSTHAVTRLTEDPLHMAAEGTSNDVEIPGRRARFLVLGTKSGAVVAWNARERPSSSDLLPVRTIQTESPQVSSVAASSLYIVHGGSDGLVQAWDPLASNTEVVRTLNARSNGRVPRHMVTMNPALSAEHYCAASAIYLDPDPTVLRGIVSFGAFMRYWSYSSTPHHPGRKRRLRHSDIHGRIASRRHAGTSSRYIAAEEAELRRENEDREREKARLRSRFGVGALGDLTEEEQLLYAQMVSEEAFAVEEQRRTSDSAEASIDTASSWSETTAEVVTPEASVAGPSASAPIVEEDSDYEQQVQQALRLSLMEGVKDVAAQSPPSQGPGDFEFAVKFRPMGGKNRKTSRSGSNESPSASHTPSMPSLGNLARPSTQEEEDLALALSLSMADQESSSSAVIENGHAEVEEFPTLMTEGVGKGKGVSRW